MRLVPKRMKSERSLVLFALVTCAVPLVFWLWTFWSPAFATDQGKWSEFGGFIGGVISPILAFASFIGLLATIREQRAVSARQNTKNDDLNYFNHATASLERSYITLAGELAAREPLRDRLAWLSSARLLMSAADVSKRISPLSVGLHALYEGEEEHWRRRFYELFHPQGLPRIGFNGAYFSESFAPHRAQIDERSIRVIFEFLTWPGDKADPIDLVNKYTSEELDAMGSSMSGVREYVRSMPRFRKSPSAV